MILRLERVEIVPAYTMGQLYVDGAFECWVLEDPVREGPKVYGATAIPFGQYAVTVDFSNRFKKMLPHVLNVPGFAGIRIHAGNTVHDTEGCLLVGCDRVGATVQRSRQAFLALMPKLQLARERGEEVTLEIVKSEAAS